MLDSNNTASFLDKTDWRKTIHRALEDCVRAEGTPYYCSRVKSLVSAFAAEYPNFDAKRLVLNKKIELEYKYSTLERSWLRLNSGKRRWQKYWYHQHLMNCLCHDIFDFIKNLCARKRMLLWGTKSIGGGFQMED